MANPQYLSNSDGAPLTDKLRVSMTQHLNKDHLEDMLACAKGMAGLDWAEKVRVISLDADGINLEVSGAGKIEPLRLDFPNPVNGVLAFRHTVGEMIAESRAKLGWATSTDN
jgi:putative heme iron utilization protein